MAIKRWRNTWVLILIVEVLSIVIIAPVQAQNDIKHRGDIEKKLGPIEKAYRSKPSDKGNCRAYADILFKLGNIWQANEVIAPFVTSSSSNIDDLQLSARTALLISKYNRAEALFNRLRELAEDGSEAQIAATEGLVMVYYQTNQYPKSKGLKLPDRGEKRNLSTLLTFMKRFEGKPYQIEWEAPDKVPHLPIINDFSHPGALPLMKLQINGHPVMFILDTGGDRLYIDESVAKTVNIKTIAKRQARYAYTKGEYVDEPLGVADTVTMGEVTLRNVPVIVAKWKVMLGKDQSDGVVTTQILKQFLSTVDYENKRITLREKNATGRHQLLDSFGDKEPHQMPFFMTSSHLMFTKGSLNGHGGMNMFMDSGLAASMPLIILDETVEFLGLEKHDIEGTKFYWSPIESHGIGSLVRGATQALGNVMVEKNPYWHYGFIFDALISHQFLRHLGSWTIDFDTMTYLFPVGMPQTDEPTTSPATSTETIAVQNPEVYLGSYEVTAGVVLEISTADGILFLQVPGQKKVPLQANTDGTYSIPLAGAKVIFEKNESGTITGFVLHQGSNETRAMRK